MEDPHKKLRGELLGQWVRAHGGATQCLVAAGYEQGTKEFRARESYLSNAVKVGIGHRAAIRFEQEFESGGMPPGYLTDRLDASRVARAPMHWADDFIQTDDVRTAPSPSSRGLPNNNREKVTSNFGMFNAKSVSRAPIVQWGQLGVNVRLSKGNDWPAIVAPAGFCESTIVWTVQDESMSPDFNPGDFIALDPREDALQGIQAGEAVIVETNGGTHLLRYYVPLVDGHFEAHPSQRSRHGVLSSMHIPLKVRAIVTAHLRLRTTRGITSTAA